MLPATNKTIVRAVIVAGVLVITMVILVRGKSEEKVGAEAGRGEGVAFLKSLPVEAPKVVHRPVKNSAELVRKDTLYK